MKPLRVLLLEDDPNDALFVQRKLHEIAVVDVASSKEQFVQMLKDNWDVVILDWSVGELKGNESAEITKRALLDAPMILLTGSLDESSAANAMKLGFVDFLNKDRIERLPHAVLEANEKRLLKQQAMRDHRLEIVGHMTTGLCHDLNQILQVFVSGPEILRRVIAERPAALTEEISRVLDVMESTAKRGAEMSRQIASFVRGANGSSLKAISPEFLLTELRSMVQDTFPKNIRITTGAAPGTSLAKCDPVQIGQVLLNLVVNARDCLMPHGGEIFVTAQNASTDSGNRVRIQVRDTGPGITSDVLPQIFNAFYTTKGIGQGTGLGLSMAQKIMRDHGGNIDVKTGDEGTSFFIYLPTAHVETHAESVDRLEQFDGDERLILVVDDEAYLRSLIEMFLRDANYKTLSAASGLEAMSFFRSNRNIVLLLTDVIMPYLTGPQLLENLRGQNYDLPVIFLTGDPEVVFNPEPTAILAKPFSRKELLSKVREVLTIQPDPVQS